MYVYFLSEVSSEHRLTTYSDHFDAASKYFSDEKIPIQGTTYFGLGPIEISWDLLTDCNSAHNYLRDFRPYLKGLKGIDRIEFKESLILNIYHS